LPDKSMGAILGPEISDTVNRLLEGRSNINLLEAGCGSASYFNFAPTVRSVGIDISAAQLERNTVLHEKIQGDLETYPLPRNQFDIVVCWDVIEHLSHPRKALLNMFEATKPGGFVILGFPNLASFKGLATKFTPFWFHKLSYAFMKYKSTPFKTYLRFAILPGEVANFARANGFSVIYSKLLEGGMTRRVRERFWICKIGFATMNLAARIATLGSCQSLYFDSCAFVLQKNGAG